MKEVPHDLREKIRFASMFPIAGITILVATLFLVGCIVYILVNPAINRLFGIEAYRMASYKPEVLRSWMAQIHNDPNRYQLVFWFLVAFKVMLVPVYLSFGSLASELSRGWSRVGVGILLISVPISLIAWFSQLWVPQMLVNLARLDDPAFTAPAITTFAYNSFLFRLLDAASYHIADLGLLIFAFLLLRHKLWVVKSFSIIYFVSFILDILADFAIFGANLGSFEYHLWSMGVLAAGMLVLSSGFMIHGHLVRQQVRALRSEGLI
jgi:hypothetical protein